MSPLAYFPAPSPISHHPSPPFRLPGSACIGALHPGQKSNCRTHQKQQQMRRTMVTSPTFSCSLRWHVCRYFIILPNSKLADCCTRILKWTHRAYVLVDIQEGGGGGGTWSTVLTGVIAARRASCAHSQFRSYHMVGGFHPFLTPYPVRWCEYQTKEIPLQYPYLARLFHPMFVFLIPKNGAGY